ncbi:MAG: hypothetical protein M1820_007128 [Bogoriella megaspora]|nr:MAG: hypothetical protein M1820_007128 [Bogoriella megaspora]
MAKSHTARRDEGRRRPDRRRKRRRADTGSQGSQGSRCIERSSRDAPTIDELRAKRAAYFGRPPDQRRRERLSSRMSYVADSRPRAVSSKTSSRGGARTSEREPRRRYASDEGRSRRGGDVRGDEETVYVYRRVREEGTSRRHPTRPPVVKETPESPGHSRSSTKTNSTPHSLRRSKPTRDTNAPRDEYREAQGRVRRAEPPPAAPPPSRRISTQYQEVRYTVPVAEAPRTRPPAPPAQQPRTRSSTVFVEPQKPARSVSVRENVPVMTRPSLRRSNTTTRTREPPPTRPISYAAPPAAVPAEQPAPSIAPTTRSRRNSGLFSRFRPPPPPPERRIECLTCLQDDIPISKSAKLSCGHQVAKEAGWQRCYNCRAMVELREGCNHMTCRCTAEFCMICGAPWKTCDCPWFNYTPVPEDRLYHMNVPGNPEPIRIMYRQIPGQYPQHQQQHAQGHAAYHYNPRNPGPGYQQEMERRRTQERADEHLARRLQTLGFASDEEVDVYARPAAGREWGIGNAGGHFMNENYVRNAADLITAGYGQARVAAAHARAEPVDPAAAAARAAAVNAHAHAQRQAQAQAQVQAQIQARPQPQPQPQVHQQAQAHAPVQANPNAQHPSANVRRRTSIAPTENLRNAQGRSRSCSERAREFFAGRCPSTRRNTATAVPPPAPAAPAPPGAPAQPGSRPATAASAMAGLAMDGSRTGMGRVGTWLQHVENDPAAVQTAAVAG